MKKILFLIPDSTGIRNYLYSDLLSQISSESKIFFWSVLPEEAFLDINNFNNDNFIYSRISFFREGFRTKFYREAASYARLLHNSRKTKNATILTNWQFNPAGVKRKVFNQLVQFVGAIISWRYGFILSFESKSRNSWKLGVVEEYKNKLEMNGIDKIFITHQRVAEQIPICLAAKELGIEVFSAIYSWDNLPKGRLNVVADYYLVWSTHMKKEMNFYYPEIEDQKVCVTGTPQFEFYGKSANIIEKEEFAKLYDLDLKKNWILYSGGDVRTSPFDQNYLSDLLEVVENRWDVQVILRRSPADFSVRYDEVIKRDYKNLRVIDPNWTVGKYWSENIPKNADFALLTSLACHCLAAINVGSTVAHDFANFDKPTIYINYNTVTSDKWSIFVINEFQHFKSMPSKECVVWVNDRSEWNDVFDSIIYRKDSVANDRLKWYRIINEQLEMPPSILIARHLLNN